MRSLPSLGLACAIALLSVLFFPSAYGIDQAESQKTAARVNNLGSDDSMEAATTSGMMAIMNLAALNIGGAISYGYRGYGQYMNSEKLDDLEAKTTHLKNRMASVGANPGATGGDISARPTTFSRLNPDFLRKGKASEVAEEFEKRSGMGRETFLKHLGSATDSGLSYGDPNLLRQIEGRYALFKTDVKNPEFLSGLEKVETMFPQSAREQLLGKFRDMYLGSPSDPESAQALAGVSADGREIASVELPPPSPAAQAPEPVSEVNAPLVAATPPETLPDGITPVETVKNFLGLAGKPQETLNEFLNSPSEGDNDTIFVKVSRKYRVLTPAILSAR